MKRAHKVKIDAIRYCKEFIEDMKAEAINKSVSESKSKNISKISSSMSVGNFLDSEETGSK